MALGALNLLLFFLLLVMCVINILRRLCKCKARPPPMTSVVVQVDGPGAREVATNTEETYADVAPSQVRDGYLHTAEGETRELAYYPALLRGSVLDGQEQHHVGARWVPCERADRDRADVFTPWLLPKDGEEPGRYHLVPDGAPASRRVFTSRFVHGGAPGTADTHPWWQTPLIGYSGEPGRADATDQVARWPEHEGAAKGMTLRRHHKNLDQREERRAGRAAAEETASLLGDPTRGGQDPTARTTANDSDTREIMAELGLARPDEEGGERE